MAMTTGKKLRLMLEGALVIEECERSIDEKAELRHLEEEAQSETPRECASGPYPYRPPDKLCR